MPHASKVIVNASQSIAVAHIVQQIVITNGLPNWLYMRLGGSDLPGASNADVSIAPLSMASIPVVPTRNFGITVGEATILAVTNVPIKQAVIVFYEQPIPVTLGQVPLSPGGFRYRQVLSSGITRSDGDVWSVDLSNFTYFRYYVLGQGPSGRFWALLLRSVSVGIANPVPLGKTFPQNDVGHAALAGNAGCVLQISLECQLASGAASSITLTDQVEAW